MQPGIITKVTNIFKRKNGSEVMVVAEAFFGDGLTRSIGVRVHRRDNPSVNWALCNDRPHKNWRQMSVDEYVEHGRSEMLQVASPGEILKTASMIGQPMSSLSH